MKADLRTSAASVSENNLQFVSVGLHWQIIHLLSQHTRCEGRSQSSLTWLVGCYTRSAVTDVWYQNTEQQSLFKHLKLPWRNENTEERTQTFLHKQKSTWFIKSLRKVCVNSREQSSNFQNISEKSFRATNHLNTRRRSCSTTDRQLSSLKRRRSRGPHPQVQHPQKIPAPFIWVWNGSSRFWVLNWFGLNWNGFGWKKPVFSQNWTGCLKTLSWFRTGFS